MGKITRDNQGRTVYEDRKDAEERRRRGDKIYYVYGIGYYIIHTKKNGFWDRF